MRINHMSADKRATTSEKGQYTNILTAQQAIPTCGFGCGKDATMECLTCQCAMCSECFGDLHKKPAFVHHESGALGDLGMYCTLRVFELF